MYSTCTHRIYTGIEFGYLMCICAAIWLCVHLYLKMVLECELTRNRQKYHTDAMYRGQTLIICTLIRTPPPRAATFNAEKRFVWVVWVVFMYLKCSYLFIVNLVIFCQCDIAKLQLNSQLHRHSNQVKS